MTCPLSAQNIVLASFEHSWNGQWRLTLDQKSELFSRVASGGGKTDARITQEDILKFAEQDDNRSFLLGFPRSVQGLGDVRFVRDVLGIYDVDSGCLEKPEWDAFLDTLERCHYEYVLTLSFMDSRAFYGRGQPCLNGAFKSVAGLTEDVVKTIASGLRTPRMLQLGLDRDCTTAFFPPGWLNDLLFYSSNTHPLHGIFAADPMHRLCRKERAAMELASVSFMVTTARLMQTWVGNRAAPIKLLSRPLVFNLLVVTIPGMLVSKLLLFLFKCPSGLLDKSRVDRSAITRSRFLSAVSEGTGYLLILLGVLGLNRHLLSAPARGIRSVKMRTILACRLQSYAISWLLMTLLTFNPLVAWGQPDPAKAPCFGDLFGVGQWRIEKQRFQRRCLNAFLQKGILQVQDDSPGRGPRS
eukprot:TRINITY_DN55216_c0_g1_i1.p1 TRINITY_DN55216_c0_g1~~TRINITY_DN55216_c0_g1_i1.p1  ORF type:complete len:412 (-),score=19.95 TRINITY_DN55216_c0_g1_i1:78-1313(-)